MKVKVKKALLGVPVGTVFEANKSRTVQYKLSLGKEYISIEIDLTKPNEWFEILPEAPIWVKESWFLDDDSQIMIANDSGTSNLFDIDEDQSRLYVITYLPTMYQLLNRISTAPIHQMHEIQVQVKELLKELE